MKAIGLFTLGIASVILALSNQGFAITTKELTLNCGGTFRVLTSKAYEHANPPRLGGSTYGIHETVEVTSITGPHCEKLEPGYGVAIKVGQIHQVNAWERVDSTSVGLTPEEYATIKKLPSIAQGRIGKTFSFKAKQHFDFVKSKTNELPLFPLVHSEYVTVLSMGGQANVQKLYGTPMVLSDQQIVLLLRKLQGLVSLEESSFDDDVFLGALLMLTPKSLGVYKEYANILVNLFEAQSKKRSTVYAYSSIVSIGKKLNAVLGLSNGSKYQTQLQILQEQPLLLSEPVISEILGQPTFAPQLTAPQIEAFLHFAYEKSVALKAATPQHYELAVLRAQYKLAGVSIAKYSKEFVKGPHKLPAAFTLTAKAAQLLQALLAL